MPILPYILLWSVMAAAALALAGLRSRPKTGALLSILAVIVAAGLWLWARPTAGDPPPTASFLGYAWSVSSGAWQLTGMVLLALLSVCVLAWLEETRLRDPAAGSNGTLLPVALGVGVLPFLWAGDPLTAATTLTFFTVVWLVVLWRAGGIDPRSGRSFGRLSMLLLVPLALIWFADALALSGVGGSAWIELGGAAVLLAAAILLGIWPLAYWRSATTTAEPVTALALAGLPPIAGAAILLPVAQQPVTGGAQLALGVIVGFLALLLGLRWAGFDSLRFANGLAGALGGVVLLSAVFATESAVLAAASVAVFAPLVLAVIAHQHAPLPEAASGVAHPLTNRFHAAVVGAVWLAVMGLPLTAGWISIGQLYGSWQSGTLYVLMAILVLLLIAWSVVLSQIILRLFRQSNEAEGPVRIRTMLVGLLPALIAFIGLFRINPAALSGSSILTWVTILIPLAVGPILAWFLDDRLELPELSRNDILPDDRFEPVRTAIARGWTATGDAVAEAIAILEGPNGLLLVLLVVALLFLII